MAYAENLALFLADFGDDGLLGGQPVRVLFDAPGALSTQGDIAASVVEPQVQIATAMVPASSFGLSLSVPQGNFTVREHLPDGTGMSLLLLTRA